MDKTSTGEIKITDSELLIHSQTSGLPSSDIHGLLEETLNSHASPTEETPDGEPLEALEEEKLPSTKTEVMSNSTSEDAQDWNLLQKFQKLDNNSPGEVFHQALEDTTSTAPLVGNDLYKQNQSMLILFLFHLIVSY